MWTPFKYQTVKEVERMLPFYSVGIHVQICGSNELNMHNIYKYIIAITSTEPLYWAEKETKLTSVNTYKKRDNSSEIRHCRPIPTHSTPQLANR